MNLQRPFAANGIISAGLGQVGRIAAEQSAVLYENFERVMRRIEPVAGIDARDSYGVQLARDYRESARPGLKICIAKVIQ